MSLILEAALSSTLSSPTAPICPSVRYRKQHFKPLPLPLSDQNLLFPKDIKLLFTIQPHLPAHPNPLPPRPIPPPRSLTGLFATLPCNLTPSTTFSNCVSTTTPPTTISLNVACNVSKLKIRSNSQTFSNSLSSASTYTCIRSIRARGDSVDVEMMMK